MAQKAKNSGRKARFKSLARRSRRPLLEALEARQLFAADLTPTVTPPTPVAFAEVEPNDFLTSAQYVPLGTGNGQVRGVNLSGAVNPATSTIVADSDIFALDLRAGDILDVSITGAAGSIDLFGPNNQYLMGSFQNDATVTPFQRYYPAISPLQTAGNALLSIVITQTGRHKIQFSSDDFTLPTGTVVPPQAGSYVANMRVYRPVLESQPIGTEQILLLDFDGEVFPRAEVVPQLAGIARIDGPEVYLPQFNLLPSDENAFIDKTVTVVEQIFQDVANRGTNGDYGATGIPGQFSIRVANSRDNPGLWGQPNVSRIVIGSSTAEFGLNGIFGVASSIDVGNFDTTETVWVPVDQMAAAVNAVPRRGAVAPIDAYAQFLGNTIVHEAAHFFGLRHTQTGNTTYSLIDSGTQLLFDMGAGLNGIYEGGPGKGDDILSVIERDRLEPAEGYRGFQDSLKAMAFSLPTGTVGGTLTGRVFNDANRDTRIQTNEVGLANATVFVDLNRDGVLTPGEPSVITDTSGNYSLPAQAGTYPVILVTPSGFASTNPTINVTVTAGQSLTNQNFPVTVLQNRLGTVFQDVNGNRLRDNTEIGLERVLVYVDINGDDKPGISEPQTLSSTDGQYSLVFPGPGTYTIRDVVPAGFRQTLPTSGEYRVIFNGTTVVDAVTGQAANFDFGLRPSRDFGDLPTTYGSASHGISDVGNNGQLTLGATIDEDASQQFSADATGDDQVTTAGAINDEDGVILLDPLTPGGTARFQVSTVNTTSVAASVVAYADINGNNTFEASEKFIDQVMGTETRTFPLPIPTNAPAVLNVRFRYSNTAIQPATGDLNSGEVEDYQFVIQATGNVVSNDIFTVPVNSGGGTPTNLNVLLNDFDNAQSRLTIVSKGDTGTQGVVAIAPDGRSINFTPFVGFRGQTTFTYTVEGPRVANRSLADRTATVTVNVAFVSAAGLAVDDSFNVQEGSTNQVLDVLANDIPAVNGQITVVSARSLLGKGTAIPADGGRAVRYSAPFGSTGTDQVEYTITDGLGNTSKAIATVHLLAGDLADDLVEFNFVTKSPSGAVLTSIQQGQDFYVEVYVRDLRPNTASPVTPTLPGLGAAYLDFLYPAKLVSTIPNSSDSDSARIGADVQFNSTFGSVRTGSASVPGLIDEIGATQGALAQVPEARPTTATRPGTLLFKVHMRADAPGTATFIGDPADASISDVSLISPVGELGLQQVRYNRTSLNIVPNNTLFAFAKDDHFINPVPNTETQILDVLANDVAGSSGEIKIISRTPAARGTVTILDQGTSDPKDDRISYRANTDFTSGVDQFTYTIQSLTGELSTATVTVHIGTTTSDTADDLVLIQLNVFKDGKEVTEVKVNDEFQLRVSVKDRRDTAVPNPAFDRRGVFAAFADILYNQNLASVVTTGLVDDGAILGFDIEYFAPYNSGIISGDVFFPGVINDVGAAQSSNGSGNPTGNGLLPMFEVTLKAKATGVLTFVADPANENRPFTDTLLFEPPNPVIDISKILYTFDSVTIKGPSSEFTNPINPFDVNDDGDISPVDALMIINSLNSVGIQTFGSGEPGSATTNKLFVDVNGDAKLTPIDALAVINVLNSMIGSGESGSANTGIGAIARATNSSTGNGTVPFDASNVTPPPSVYGSSQSPFSLNGNSDADEDEDDLFDVIASDVANALNN